MKGIILAGGHGTRLYPLTRVISKQLLPVYDKPVIFYPLSLLMLANIQEILIISTPQDTPKINDLLGDGSHLGLHITYKIQQEPRGIAEAFLIGKDFIGDEPVCLILGDNLLFGHNLVDKLNHISSCIHECAHIFAYHVQDPERFGVVEFDDTCKVISIEEKPQKAKSNWAITGLYFYGPEVVSYAEKLKPSTRGELEITDINRMYLEDNKLFVTPLGRGVAWLDLGTHDSLLVASQFVQTLEKRQGLKIACLEEIAYRKGYISDADVRKLADSYRGNAYGEYLVKILSEHPYL